MDWKHQLGQLPFLSYFSVQMNHVAFQSHFSIQMNHVVAPYQNMIVETFLFPEYTICLFSLLAIEIILMHDVLFNIK